MGAVWYRARAGLRRSWLTTIGLVVFVAVPFGIVLATTAGARRAHDALPEFLAFNQPYDTLVFTDADPHVAARLRREVTELPQWDAAVQVGAAVVAVQRDDRWLVNVAFASPDRPTSPDLERPLIIDGRPPDPDDAAEVAVNEAMARDLGLHAGDRFEVRTIDPNNLEAVSNGVGEAFDPIGRQRTMTVAAVVRNPNDLVVPRSVEHGSFSPDTWRLELGPAYVAEMGDDLANYGYGVAGRVHPGQFDALAEAVHEIGGDSAQVSAGNEGQDSLAASSRGIDVETNALLVFTLLALVTAVVLVGQALGRQVTLDLADADALRAAGLDRRQRALVPLGRAAAVAVAGSAGAAVLAVALSPLFPIGVARRAEIHPGVAVDPLVVAGGAALLAVVLLAWAGLVAWRASAAGTSRVDATVARSRAARPLSALAAAAGAPVAVVEGSRMAFARGRGRAAVPVVSAVVATTAAVTVLAAILVFSASLDHLVATPELQGWRWDVTAGNFNTAVRFEEATTALRESEVVEDFVGFGTGPIEIDGAPAYSAVFGPGAVEEAAPVLDGRLPAAVDEVAVGAETLRVLDKEVGDTLRFQVGPGQPAVDLRIVGVLVPPAGLDRQLTLGKGVALTLAGARAAAPEFGLIPQSFLVRFTPGTSVEEGIEALRPVFGDAVGVPPPPADVSNLSRVQRLPRLLALLVALMALGTLANVLVTSIRRRRRDLATLAALGFRHRQLGSTVAVQATTFATVALLVGVPLGVAVGRVVWRLVADSISSSALPATPLAMLALVALATLAAANLIAALPARTAARTRPASVLRSE